MALATELTRLLDIRHPILLAPMGAVSGGRLAAAVTRAGGLGLLGPGYFGPDWIEQQFDAAGNTPVGIGFITWHRRNIPSSSNASPTPAPYIPLIRQTAIVMPSCRPETCGPKPRGSIIVAQGRRPRPCLRGGMGLIHGRRCGGTASVVGASPAAAAGPLWPCGSHRHLLRLGKPWARRPPDASGQGTGDETLRTTIFDAVRTTGQRPSPGGR
jgi:nitronate monooxygenase